MRRVVAPLLALVVGLLLAGCGEPDRHPFDPAATDVTVRFTDSSVPPEHHRSFVVTVVDGVATVVVDSYGDETARDEADVEPAAVAAVVEAYASGALDPALAAEEDVAGCAGGTTWSLRLVDGSHEGEMTVYRCGGENEEASDAIRDAVEPLLSTFDMATLTDGRHP